MPTADRFYFNQFLPIRDEDVLNEAFQEKYIKE